MSKMRRMEFKNIIIVYLSFCCFSILYSQEFNELYKLYDNYKFRDLLDKIQFYEKTQPDNIEILFFKTIFNRNGTEAVETYKELLEKADGRLKNYLNKKIAEYYYAKGYYITAAQYLESKTDFFENGSAKDNDIEKDKIPDIKPAVNDDSDNPRFRIQVGAFSIKENADQIKDMLYKHAIYAVIVERVINKQKLYCVWINGKNNFEESREYAEMIKKKYDLDYHILKP